MSAKTKSDWIAECATRFAERAGMTDEQAATAAATCWDECLDELGAESLVLRHWKPADAADEEMSAWVG